ncbi:DUF4375 domain-containing protein [Hyphomicrobium sp.]|uniref:DMP19 family protein n=1 Tax=Hyphomicrobium sp. TaxID=82 RepID=UPI0025B8F928|nr:DUF4375 domain-containing protein [Hyphomicrobium sp.]MCC7251583.1 DUF4375 domain-containing protein [Hyphomicrobium sp.]
MQANPAAYDPDSLSNRSRIPFWELIGHVVGRYAARDILDPPEKFAKSLEPLDPHMRTLVLLYSLQTGMGRDGLYTYFYRRSGQHAPAVRDALHAAGLAEQRAVFTKAMALFGRTYPSDTELRIKALGYATPSGKLNALDHSLLALSDTFGSQRGWIATIVAYVNRTPGLWQRIESTRTKLSDAARFEHLSGALLAALDFWQPHEEIRQRLAALAKPERTVLLLAAFNDEFENGGVRQFFYNAAGSVAPEIQEALADVGLERQADLVKRGIAMFQAPYPRDTQHRRETHFHNRADWTDWDERLSVLTNEFYALDGGPQVLRIGGDLQIQGGPGLRHAMLSFVRDHDMLPC